MYVCDPARTPRAAVRPRYNYTGYIQVAVPDTGAVGVQQTRRPADHAHEIEFRRAIAFETQTDLFTGPGNADAAGARAGRGQRCRRLGGKAGLQASVRLSRQAGAQV